MDIIQIAVICIVCAILSRVIVQTNQELSTLVSIAAVILVAFSILISVSDVLSGINRVISSVGISIESIGVAFKALGICYVCELSSASCRDCGESALASAIDISGKVAISIVCLPLLDSLMEVVKNILEM